MMTRSFKVYAALLSYPTQDICDAASAFSDVLDAENLIAKRNRVRVDTLIEQLVSRDLYDLQERYVELFDRSRTLSLHLFEHVHGESRDRGQAMAANELPDFLPLFLEFLSELPLAEARTLLGETAHVLDALTERLRKRKSLYTAVMRNLALIADRAASQGGAKVETPADESQSLEAIDQAWEDEQVVFGPDPSAGCPIAEDMLSQMAVPPKPKSTEGDRP